MVVLPVWRPIVKFKVYKDDEQWLPFFKWFWLKTGEEGMGHGPYPAGWIARLAAKWHCRNSN